VKVVTYHRSFQLCRTLRLDVIGIEPRPGIRRRCRHLDPINEMKAQHVKLLLVEPYFDLKTPNAIAREPVRRCSCWLHGGRCQGSQRRFKIFDGNLGLLVNAIKQTGGK
jgi:hypothetical protein